MRPEFSSVSLEAGLAPSEDSEKVLGAIENILGEVSQSAQKGTHTIRVGTSDPRSLDRLHDQLRDRRVRAVARRRFDAGRSGSKTTVMINRQAATAGVVVLCDNAEESPLGPIYLTIESKRLDEVIEWLTDYPTAQSTGTLNPSAAAMVSGKTERASLTRAETFL